MNSSKCSPEVSPVYLSYTGGLLALGLLLNGLALWVLCRRLPRWTETRIYMANLAVADLCLLCALPFFLYFQKQTSKDTPLCQISQAIYLLNRYMSISLVTAAPPAAAGLGSPPRGTGRSHAWEFAAKLLQSCPTLCDPIDGSPPGSPIPGILQARVLEWVAISFSNA